MTFSAYYYNVLYAEKKYFSQKSAYEIKKNMQKESYIN